MTRITPYQDRTVWLRLAAIVTPVKAAPVPTPTPAVRSQSEVSK